MRSGRPSARRVLGLALLVILVALFAWHSATHPVDFPVYHRAAAQVLNGDFELYPTGLYDGRTAVDGHGFRYAPGIALLFVPFGALPLKAAAFLFFVFKVIIFIHTFVLVAGLMRLRDRVWGLAGVAVLTAGGYLVEEFRNGNFHFVVVWLMVVAFVRAVTGSVAAPAAALSIAIASKITPLVLLPYFVLRRALTVVIATSVFLVALWAVPAIVWGQDWNRRLTAGFLKYTFMKMEEPISSRNYSLRGAFIRFDPFGLPAETTNLLWLASTAAAAVAVLIVIWQRRDPGPLTSALHLSLMLAAMPLFSPHSQRIHFTALAVPVPVIWACVRTVPDLRSRSLGIAAVVASAAVSTVLPLLLPGRRLSLAYLDLSMYTWGALLVFIALLALSYELGRRVEEGPSNSRSASGIA